MQNRAVPASRHRQVYSGSRSKAARDWHRQFQTDAARCSDHRGDGLASGMHMDMLNRHLLMAPASAPIESINQLRESPTGPARQVQLNLPHFDGLAW